MTRRRRLKVKIRKSPWRMVRQMRNRDGRKLWHDLKAVMKATP